MLRSLPRRDEALGIRKHLGASNYPLACRKEKALKIIDLVRSVRPRNRQSGAKAP